VADPLDEIPVGIAPVVTDPADNSLKELSGKGLLFVDNTGATKMADGGTVNPIVLGMLSQLSHGMGFPLLLIQNGAGRLLAIPATNDGTQRFLGSKNGQWQEAIPDNPSCWDYDEICACPADQIAGWQLSDSGQWCLVRLDPADLVGATHFTNTNTTLITGNGTSGSPYGVNVKISAQSGNRLQILSDGLYVGPEY
jgi:hypothetical protein